MSLISDKNVRISIMIKRYNVIILGAGVSGISCAKKMLENNYNDFKIISSNIGGRIIKSNFDNVSYGAYYIMKNYYYALGLVNKKKRIKLFSILFNKNRKNFKILSKKTLKYLPELIKFIFILLKFKRHLKKFRYNCENQAQVGCLKNDRYLWDLYNIRADLFVQKNNIIGITYEYLAEVLHGTSFTPIKKINAFTFLQFSLPLIIPFFKFDFKKEEINLLLEAYFIEDEVLSVSKENDEYKILTKNKDCYFCKKIVSALPPNISKDIFGFKGELRDPVNVYMFHLKGKIKENLNGGGYNLFDENDKLLTISLEEDGTHLFYSTEEKPDFSKYFYDYSIIKQRFWNPAFNIGGSNLLEFKQDDNLYIIGDNNICGLEDSCIYGIYAGNKILGKTKD